MSSPLLETKFYPPPTRDALVPRPRLAHRLHPGPATKLMVISAPAGFGKTTLLTESLEPDRSHVAWVSLDGGDSDPRSYWTYVVTALQRAVPEVGTGALALLAESSAPPIVATLTSLLNDFAHLTAPAPYAGKSVILVLDDYHVIDSADVQQGMAFLLDHLPRGLLVVIASRADPPLPLARLRARGELVEVRAADLRFTSDESATYLNAIMGLDLTERDVDALGERTEGWIAALQLAALSMQGRTDVAGFISGFTGNDRFVVDYLAEEVVGRLSDDDQQFLLRTSILERLTGSLCDAVTGQTRGHEMLERLERGNLFVVPLDAQRSWYRYHHLFADVLQARLQAEQSDVLPDLHARASLWHEQEGQPAAAIRHALAGGDHTRAADLIEAALPAMRRNRHERSLKQWLDLLPSELIRCRPVLSIGYVGALMASGRADGVEPLLETAARWLGMIEREGLESAVEAGMVVVDDVEFGRLPTSVAIYQAGIAQVAGNADATMAHARRALELAAADDHVGHGAANALMGLAAWSRGDLDHAHAGYAEACARFRRVGHVSDELGCSLALADIRIAQGRLRDARAAYEDALRLASRHDVPTLRGTADMHVGLAELDREGNDLESAREHLRVSRDLGESAGLPQNRYRWLAAMAGVQEAEGDAAAALDLLDQAEDVYDTDFSPSVRPVGARRARVLIRQGMVEEALAWLRHRGVTSDDDLTYLREYEHITLARALLADHASKADGEPLSAAIHLLERLRAAAEAHRRVGSIIEISMLLAIALAAAGRLRAAWEPWGRALSLAAPEGYVRMFTDEGRAIADLLATTSNNGIEAAYVERLRQALGHPGDTVARRPRSASGLVDPMSPRELEVLRLLATELNGPEIARELVLSLNTVRTHTKNIYAKLGADNRRVAVRRARELRLLD